MRATCSWQKLQWMVARSPYLVNCTPLGPEEMLVLEKPENASSAKKQKLKAYWHVNKAEKECCFAIGIPSFCTARTDGVSSLLPTRVVPSHCAE